MSTPVITNSLYRDRFPVDDLACTSCNRFFEAKRGEIPKRCPGCLVSGKIVHRITYMFTNAISAIDLLTVHQLREHLQTLATKYRKLGRVRLEGWICEKLAVLNILLGDYIPHQLIDLQTTNVDSIYQDIPQTQAGTTSGD